MPRNTDHHALHVSRHAYPVLVRKTHILSSMLLKTSTSRATRHPIFRISFIIYTISIIMGLVASAMFTVMQILSNTQASAKQQLLSSLTICLNCFAGYLQHCLYDHTELPQVNGIIYYWGWESILFFHHHYTLYIRRMYTLLDDQWYPLYVCSIVR